MLVSPQAFERLASQFKQVADVVRVGHNRLSDDDRDDIVRCVVVAVERLPPGELSQIVARVRRALPRARPRSRVGYFKRAIQNACIDAGVDFRSAAQFELPSYGTTTSRVADEDKA